MDITKFGGGKGPGSGHNKSKNNQHDRIAAFRKSSKEVVCIDLDDEDDDGIANQIADGEKYVTKERLPTIILVSSATRIIIITLLIKYLNDGRGIKMPRGEIIITPRKIYLEGANVEGMRKMMFWILPWTPLLPRNRRAIIIIVGPLHCRLINYHHVIPIHQHSFHALSKLLPLLLPLRHVIRSQMLR